MDGLPRAQGFCDGSDCQKFMVVPGEFGSRMTDPRDKLVPRPAPPPSFCPLCRALSACHSEGAAAAECRLLTVLIPPCAPDPASTVSPSPHLS